MQLESANATPGQTPGGKSVHYASHASLTSVAGTPFVGVPGVGTRKRWQKKLEDLAADNRRLEKEL